MSDSSRRSALAVLGIALALASSVGTGVGVWRDGETYYVTQVFRRP